MTDKEAFRQQLRQQRRTLTQEQKISASHALLQQMIDLKLFDDAQHIAFYAAHEGEIDPIELLSYALKHEKSCYLPVIPKQSTSMHFIQIKQLQDLSPNHYGILEPPFDLTHEILPHNLDIVVVPLVAYDQHGYRLGLGKGYYDRCFSFVIDSNAKKPLLLGIAYQFQYVADLPHHSHDVSLNKVLTENELICFRD